MWAWKPQTCYFPCPPTFSLFREESLCNLDRIPLSQAHCARKVRVFHNTLIVRDAPPERPGGASLLVLFHNMLVAPDLRRLGRAQAAALLDVSPVLALLLPPLTRI